MSNYNLNTNDCPSCGKTLKSEAGVRQHHAKVHNESLPNRKCNLCETPFYDEKSLREYCDECVEYSKYSKIPEDVDMDIDEWSSLSPNERHYLRHKEEESERIKNNKEKRFDWVVENHLIPATCENCGYSDSRAIEFHHTEDNELDESPRKMSRNMRSKEFIEKEIQRGKLLCANCHMLEHHPNRFSNHNL